MEEELERCAREDLLLEEVEDFGTGGLRLDGVTVEFLPAILCFRRECEEG